MPSREPGIALLLFAAGCTASGEAAFDKRPVDPDQARIALIDRFAPEAGVNALRTPANDLPGPGAPIDFDRRPFLVQGLSADGKIARYYDFDVKSQVPAKMYVFVNAQGQPVPGQLPVVASIPGDPGYNDFWRIHQVWVRPGYQVNSVTSEADVIASSFLVVPTDQIVNRVVVPPDSSAQLRFGGGDASLGRAWYQGNIAPFLTFEERVPAQRTAFGEIAVDISYVWVAFNINPDRPGGGPPSGVMTEANGVQTHDVVKTVPGAPDYSPLWMAFMYDNAAFTNVVDLESAQDAPLVQGVPSPIVNCPVVFVAP